MEHRVQKLLSNYGFCSRRKAEELIKQGKVKVNNKVISIGDKASEKDKIYVGQKLVNKEERVYIMFHKPADCVTALYDKKYKTVMSYIKIKERIFPVGRLDFNTSGLLLLTNDGDFANKIMHPSHEIKKTYLVGLGKEITNLQIIQIEKGVKLSDGKTSPAKIKKINPTLIEITIHEGKNRIIRRIFKELDIYIRFLKRIKIGKLDLGYLKEGKWKKLTKKDIESIFG
ncbi:rRNA pseudouridine synthase [Candidatus Woesearchaeota archaeon]|nr:rRNA pseudouridine synthase [Candidatus Woesearchaeota archaeon]